MTIIKLQLGRGGVDIVASGIISMYDVNKTHNSILKTPWFHTLASHYSRNRHDTIGDIAKKNIMTAGSLRIFGCSFSAHPLFDILTKYDIKKTDSKGNIWDSYYIPKDEGLGKG